METLDGEMIGIILNLRDTALEYHRQDRLSVGASRHLDELEQRISYAEAVNKAALQADMARNLDVTSVAKRTRGRKKRVA